MNANESFNVLSMSTNCEDVLNNDAKNAQKKEYVGKSKTGREKCASIILDGKGLSVKENEEIVHQDAKNGRNVRGNVSYITDAEKWTQYVGKENVKGHYVPKGTRIYLRASSFELTENVSLIKYTSLRTHKEKGFDIKIDGKIFFLNPLLFPEGIKIKKG